MREVLDHRRGRDAFGGHGGTQAHAGFAELDSAQADAPGGELLADQ